MEDLVLEQEHTHQHPTNGKSHSSMSQDPEPEGATPRADSPQKVLDMFLHAGIPAGALLRVLVEKGIVSRTALLEAAHCLRRQEAEAASQRRKEMAASNVESERIPTRVRRSSHSHKHRWLRKRMARHRWSRRLGTYLFGWKWKRVSRHAHAGESFYHSPSE